MGLLVREGDKARRGGIHEALQLCSVDLGGHNREGRVKMSFMVKNREGHDLYHAMMRRVPATGRDMQLQNGVILVRSSLFRWRGKRGMMNRRSN